MKRLLLPLLLICFIINHLKASEPVADRGIYEIRIYHYATADQETTIDQYLKNAYLPALRRQNIKAIGVFKALANDTAVDKTIYVLIPYKSVKDFEKITDRLSNDNALAMAGASYVNATYDKPAYSRMEKILVRAFKDMPAIAKPRLTGNRQDNIYELRSYEGHTEKIFQNKVDMFNAGGEIKLFSRLGFNAVFYSEVIAGGTMPNLMYMTSFNNMKERDEHWKAFIADPEWKILSAKPQYQHNVSKIITTFLRAAEYSDL
jgi:hypothetical protein